jgi:hypothetical protein
MVDRRPTQAEQSSQPVQCESTHVFIHAHTIPSAGPRTIVLVLNTLAVFRPSSHWATTLVHFHSIHQPVAHQRSIARSDNGHLELDCQGRICSSRESSLRATKCELVTGGLFAHEQRASLRATATATVTTTQDAGKCRGNI